eukprot:scaffold157362_cov28-Tisochrysis_lutea.AAC.3
MADGRMLSSAPKSRTLPFEGAGRASATLSRVLASKRSLASFCENGGCRVSGWLSGRYSVCREARDPSRRSGRSRSSGGFGLGAETNEIVLSSSPSEARLSGTRSMFGFRKLGRPRPPRPGLA